MSPRVLAPLLLLVACGSRPAADATVTSRAAPTKPDSHDSIADIAAKQGGLAALGGAGNREESTGTELAFAGPLRAENLSRKNPPKLDGMLKEWHARTPERDAVSGSTDRLGLDVAVQFGDDTLWIAAEVEDPKLTRSASYGANEDHLTFTVAFPSGRGVLKAYEVGLWPGTPGSSPGAVKWTSGPNAGQKVAGAKVIENDVKGGVTLEATIPWSAFPDAVRVGMRAAFRWHDADGSSETGVIGTSSGSVDRPGELPALPTPAEHAVVEGLLEQKGLANTKPKIDIYADVAGDERKERVSVFGPFFTICGPGYRKGHQFFWRQIAGDIVSLETSPVSGRSGKEDLVVRRRVSRNGVNHDVLEVWSIPADREEPTTLFAHEIAIAKTDGTRRVSNAARIGSKEIEIVTEPATAWDAASFAENLAGDVEPLLVPWGSVKSQTYKLEGARFVKAGEVAQAPTGTPRAPMASASAAEPASQGDVPTPAVRKGTDLGKQVLFLFLKDAGLAATTKPRFDLEVNVDGDAQPERVVVFGRDIVVLGPSFKSGTGYARLSLTQFEGEKDLGEVTARDLTGDGAAELLVRGTRHAKSPTGNVIDVDTMFVYQVKSGSIGRVFAIETGREVSGKRVQGLVQFVPGKGGKGFDVDVRPGVAKGFTGATYPFPEEKPGAGPIEPLLLPWGSVRNVRYTWNGTQFAISR